MSIINANFIAEHWDDILAVGTVVGGWLYHKAKGDKTKTAREILDDVVRQVINAADVDLDNVKGRAERACRDALAKLGVKGAASDLLVHEFAEYAAAELAERWAIYTKDMDALKVATDKMKAAGLA